MWDHIRAWAGRFGRPRPIPHSLPKPLERIDIGGRTATFFVPNARTRNRAKKTLTKDPELIRWLNQIQPSDMFWDIGANVGVFSIYAALMRRCHVLAFEPGAANYFVLNRNIELNRVQSLVSAFCVAVAAESKFDVLNMTTTVPGSSMASFGEAIGPRGEVFAPSFKQGMLGFSLDDLADRLPKPTHIKIDVDGIELAILSGGPRMLKNEALRSLIVELDPKRPALLARAHAMLSEHGLRFSHSYEPQWEHIFVRA